MSVLTPYDPKKVPCSTFKDWQRLQDVSQPPDEEAAWNAGRMELQRDLATAQKRIAALETEVRRHSIKTEKLVIRGREDMKRIQELEGALAEVQQERDEWKDRANNAYRASIGEVWHWQGDEQDMPESLTCPVLMSADQLRAFVALRDKLDLAKEVTPKLAKANEELRAHLIQCVKALKAAKDHLEYCGYGDKWERECARDEKLPEQLDAAINTQKEIK